jgi:hypothetical protein
LYAIKAYEERFIWVLDAVELEAGEDEGNAVWWLVVYDYGLWIYGLRSCHCGACVKYGAFECP